MTTLGDILDNVTREHEERITQADDYTLGRMYNSFDNNTRELLDTLIRANKSKVAIIRYFIKELNLSLTLAKILYEAREAWLAARSNPYGW